MALQTPGGRNAQTWTLSSWLTFQKDAVRVNNNTNQLHSWLDVVELLAAGLQDIEDGKADIQDTAKAM